MGPIAGTPTAFLWDACTNQQKFISASLHSSTHAYLLEGNKGELAELSQWLPLKTLQCHEGAMHACLISFAIICRPAKSISCRYNIPLEEISRVSATNVTIVKFQEVPLAAMQLLE